MKFNKKTIEQVPIAQKTVLVRAGYDVPLSDAGEIDDDLRIRASLPTLRYLLKKHCKVVIAAHLGRPEGRDLKYSLRPVAARLQELLGQPVMFMEHATGEATRMAVKTAAKQSVILLENLRFYEGEKKNDPTFARQLARDTGAQYFIQDAFSNAHREDASMAAITQCIPSVAGLQLATEVMQLRAAIEAPERPLVAILGGAKVSDKIDVIEQFIAKADRIVIGGAMANTFLAARGIRVGSSKVQADEFETVKHIYAKAAKKVGHEKLDEFIVIPHDVAVAVAPDKTAKRANVSIDAIAPEMMCLDIGDETIEAYVRYIHGAKTVLWNGTLGYAELPQFAHGSARVAMELATNTHIASIIGGGDTADFVRHWDSREGDSFTHVSTGGGASLELLAGNRLPAVDHLLDA